MVNIMANFAIEINDLSKSFGDIKAVDRLNLRINQGEMFSIVGPDGAGKTTLIRMLCGIIPPSAGNAKILGYDLRYDIENIKKNIGYLSQRFSLYGDLSIDENIEFFAEIHLVKNYKQRRDELLEFTRLKPFRKRLADRLSGGMRQKLALACTLIHTPKIILLDEPTTGVDPVSRRDFWRILANLLKTGITIMMTTPYLDEAERCNRVGMMNKGKLMVVDTPKKIKSLMEGTIIEIVCTPIRQAFYVLRNSLDFLDVQAFGDRLNVIVKDKNLDLPKIENQLKNNGIKIKNWRVISPSLENVFIKLLRKNKGES